MTEAKILINDNEYAVKLAVSEEEKEIGLQGCKSLQANEGMLFIYNEPETQCFWMQNCELPLDIIFIDEDWEVLGVAQGQPNSEDRIECDDVKYVLELNQNSGVKEGDEVDLSEIEPDEDVESEEDEETEEKHNPMIVVGPRGKTAMELLGGERIYSRGNTKTLVRLAKRGYKSKLEKDYKQLGRKMFEYIKIQDSNKPEYVELKDKN